MNFEKYLPKAHPTKEVFKHYGFPLVGVAKYVGRTYSYMSAVLSGTAKATSEVDTKLHTLANEIKSEYQKRNGGQL